MEFIADFVSFHLALAHGGQSSSKCLLQLPHLFLSLFTKVIKRIEGIGAVSGFFVEGKK